MSKSSGNFRPVPHRFGFLSGAVIWSTIACLHYLLCGQIAHWLGNPLSLPGWMSGINRFFRYGPEAFLSFAVELLWLAIIVVTIFLFAVPAILFMPKNPGPPDDPAQPQESFAGGIWRGFFSCIPLYLLTLLTLAILPLQSHNMPSAPSDLELAKAMTWDEYLAFSTQGLAMLFYIYILFIGIFAAVMLMMRLYGNEGGGFAFLICILFGIALSLVSSMTFSPAILYAQERLGISTAFFAVFLGLSLILVPAGWLMLGSLDGKKKPEEEQKGLEAKD